MEVRKAIIPVAGLGTRMLPATKSIPKEMLPVFDKPLIQYIVEEAVTAGIKDIVLVTRPGKSAIDNHFTINAELESILAQKGRHDLLSAIRKSIPEDISICSITQHEAKGLGHAVLCARPIICNQPFVVLLPDVLIDEHLCISSKGNLSAMIHRFNQTGYAQVMVEAVPMQKVHQYGVVDCQNYPLLSGKTHQISDVVEKPKPDSAPSNLCIVGRYVFDANIWSHLDKVKPDATGEIQLTNAIATLIQQHIVEAYSIVGQSHDCGDKYGYAKASLAYALRDHRVGSLLEQYMKENMHFEHKSQYALAVNE